MKGRVLIGARTLRQPLELVALGAGAAVLGEGGADGGVGRAVGDLQHPRELVGLLLGEALGVHRVHVDAVHRRRPTSSVSERSSEADSLTGISSGSETIATPVVWWSVM